MFGMRWRLFRLLGIPVSVDASWLVILALLTLSFSNDYPDVLNRYFPGGRPAAVVRITGSWAWSRPWRFSCASSSTNSATPSPPVPWACASTASRSSCSAAFRNSASEPPSAGTEFLMAVAGPAVSLLLAVVFGLLTWVGLQRRDGRIPW